MNATEIEAIISAATGIVNEIIRAAPAVEQGIVDAQPYVEAIVGLISGTNVTQDQLDAAVAKVQALSEQFQLPLD